MAAWRDKLAATLDALRARSRWVVGGFAVVVLSAWLAFLHYTLPAYDLVTLTGFDTVRMDRGVGSEASVAGANPTRDVRLMNALTVNGKDVRVFRNEDTGWGWPPYLKFDAGTLQSKAQGIMADTPKANVLVKHYGWRVEMLSMYPNALDVEVTEATDAPFPWQAVLWVVLIHGTPVLGFLWARKWWRAWQGRKG